MTKRWRIHEETLAELDATVAWYDEQRAGLGLEFLTEVRRRLSELREAPNVSTADRSAPAEARVQRRRLRRFPYAIVFAETTSEYVVIAVMHLRRRPGYWLSRIAESS
ncbi:MAG: hypothetical protein KF894_15810 [Labilithrix sp.]|nr:hypothetical protein [Labilithrix sp.]